MKRLNFALLGCGKISRKHIDALANIESAQLVAVCDDKPERAREVGKRSGVPSFTSLAQMLEQQKDIDIVNILTPSGLHADHAICAASYGKHVVVEKPLALRLEDADNIISACDRAGVRLFVVKQNRFNPPVKRAFEALERGRFGKLVLGTVRLRWCRRQDYYDQADWRGTWPQDGGVLANQAAHHIDLLTWFMGDVESLYAKSATRLVNIQAEDTAVVVLKFVNGALGVIEATTAARPTDLEGSLSILGEKGSVVIGGFAANELTTWKFDEMLPDDEDVFAGTSSAPHSVYPYAHRDFLEDVVKCINFNKQALIEGLVGRKSLELITAIYESCESQQEVRLRFQPRLSRLGRA